MEKCEFNRHLKSDCILQGSRSDFTRGGGRGGEACVSDEVICESTDMAGQEGGLCAPEN